MRRLFVALALAVALPLPVLAGQVTVKEGETLSEIAERHGVSLNQLMQINGIRDADLVEAGRTLTLPGSSGGGPARSGPGGVGGASGEVRHGMFPAALGLVSTAPHSAWSLISRALTIQSDSTKCTLSLAQG